MPMAQGFWPKSPRIRRYSAALKKHPRKGSGSVGKPLTGSDGDMDQQPTAATPLAGVRIIDFTWGGVGPFGTSTLANLVKGKPFDLYPDQRSQVYVGLSGEKRRLRS